MNFAEKSYALHEKPHDLSDEQWVKYNAWFDQESIGSWRFKRMFTPLKAIVGEHPSSSWITLGDGSFGLDAIRLGKLGDELKVLPTDINVSLLEVAKDKGWIKDFEKINAEGINKGDDSFDFALVKEAYHHFPRPYLALYEMIRVAAEGLVLIEPNDHVNPGILGQIVNGVKGGVKRILGKSIYHTDKYRFEEVGNYVYTISRREIEKFALGLQLPHVAFYEFNDAYIDGIEFEAAVESSLLFKKLKRKIRGMDRRASLGLRSPSNMVAVVFKRKLKESYRRNLQQAGFDIVDLPANPYLD